MIEVRHERRRWVAILAATVLVLQALLNGLGAGTAAAAPAPMLDAFGSVICSYDGSAGHGTPEQPPSHHRDHDCLAHCALSLHAALPATSDPGLLARLVWRVDAPVHPRTAAVPGAPAIGPHGPRGPPA